MWVRVLVTGQLPREVHNAPLHLFSASPELVDFASTAYHRGSEDTSSLLGAVREASEGGLYHVVYDGGFPAR